MRIIGLITLIAASALFAQQPATPTTGAAGTSAAHKAALTQYCVTCHNDRLKTGGLVLDKPDMNNVGADADMWEKVIVKLRGGMMPPPGMPRPQGAALDNMATYLEHELDKVYLTKANPGKVGIHRLNRAEYANAVRDLLHLDIDPTDLLPADDANFGFDNIADALTVSPVLLERYLNAAWKISSLAVGDLKITPNTATYHTKPDASQDGHVEGLPLGTRGGLAVKHNFPLDGEYLFKVRFWGNTVNTPRGMEIPNDVEVLLDGVRIKRVTIGGTDDANLSNVNPTAGSEAISKRVELQVPVKAGPHVVGVTFLRKSSGPTVDLLEPFDREKLDPINTAGIPEIDFVSVTGPLNPTGPGDTPSRRRLFVCQPGAGVTEVACAKRVLETVAKRAYRRPVTAAETERLLTYYQRGRNTGGTFESGIQTALAFVLVNPQFTFRAESDKPNAAPGTPYRINDVELASRLSFFLWSSIPDDELVNLATAGRLKDPVVLEAQVKRMLLDKRSNALLDNFLGQWLYLRNLRGAAPDSQIFPDFDDNLRQAFQKETEMLMAAIIREDRSVVDLITADYTFVNERLAKHYGIPNIYGNQFRKVKVTDPARRGLMGHGSVLTVSSYPNRTSPVLRGKWIMTNILGTPPPPPPPNVPPLKEVASGTMRQRMEQHRANPACASCHKVMDPIGFSLENFDAIGAWRTTDQDEPIDASGQLADGTKIDGVIGLQKAVAAKPEQFVRTITQVLMVYALGRGTEAYDMPVVRGIARDAGKKDNKFSAIIMGIVNSQPFQMKMARQTSQTVAAK